MQTAVMSFTALVLLLAFVVTDGVAGDLKKNIKQSQRWGGIIGIQAKLSAAPKDGVISTQEAFEKLWSDWSLKDKAPKLDFTKQIVFVQIASGPNNLSTTYSLDPKTGDLTAMSVQTLRAGEGFGYGIDVLYRDGIKSYKGKAIK